LTDHDALGRSTLYLVLTSRRRLTPGQNRPVPFVFSQCDSGTLRTSGARRSLNAGPWSETTKSRWPPQDRCGLVWRPGKLSTNSPPAPRRPAHPRPIALSPGWALLRMKEDHRRSDPSPNFERHELHRDNRKTHGRLRKERALRALLHPRRSRHSARPSCTT
jgi:hypothetical protein